MCCFKSYNKTTILTYISKDYFKALQHFGGAGGGT